MFAPAQGERHTSCTGGLNLSKKTLTLTNLTLHRGQRGGMGDPGGGGRLEGGGAESRAPTRARLVCVDIQHEERAAPAADCGGVCGGRRNGRASERGPREVLRRPRRPNEAPYAPGWTLPPAPSSQVLCRPHIFSLSVCGSYVHSRRRTLLTDRVCDVEREERSDPKGFSEVSAPRTPKRKRLEQEKCDGSVSF